MDWGAKPHSRYVKKPGQNPGLFVLYLGLLPWRIVGCRSGGDYESVSLPKIPRAPPCISQKSFDFRHFIKELCVWPWRAQTRPSGSGGFSGPQFAQAAMRWRWEPAYGSRAHWASAALNPPQAACGFGPPGPLRITTFQVAYMFVVPD